MNTEKVKLNDGVMSFINKLSFLGDSLDDKVNVSLSISLFAARQVSLARAAELSNRPLTEFMDILKKINIPWCEYSEEMKNSDDIVVQMLTKETEN